MLVRRFSIVCLLVAIFGMSLAMLVAEKSRLPPMHASQALFGTCDTARVVSCR